MNFGSYTDEQLKELIGRIYQTYDRNGDGMLETPELAVLFTDLYKSLGVNVNITFPMAQQALREIDQNGDGKISPWEIYCAFKVMNSQPHYYLPTPPPQQPPEKMDVENCREWNWPDQN